MPCLEWSNAFGETDLSIVGFYLLTDLLILSQTEQINNVTIARFNLKYFQSVM